jgi:hypothetical protein
LWLLLDEWSSIALDLQPLLADLLRRSFLPVQKITVKIAAIERRSRFSTSESQRDYIGIELGADAATAVSLDDFMVFTHGRRDADEFFAQLFTTMCIPCWTELAMAHVTHLRSSDRPSPARPSTN